MPAATLTIDINARLASLEQGLAQANRSLGSFNEKVSTTGQILKGAFAGVSLGAITRQMVSGVRAVIDYNDKLGELSKTTGIAVNTLGGLGYAAKQSGSTMEGAGKAIAHLNLEIAKATSAGAGSKAAEPFEKIGISVAELKTLRPEQVFIRIADAFATYEDGANKGALGSAFFKRGYEAIIPLLDEGGKKLQENTGYFEKYGGVNDDIVAKSDRFNDTLDKLNLLSGAFSRTLTAALIGPMQGFADQLVVMKEKGDGFSSTADIVAGGITTIAKAAIYAGYQILATGRAIGALIAQADAIVHLDFKRASSIGDDRDREQDARLKERDAMLASLNASGRASGAYDPRLDPSAPQRKGDAPSLSSTRRAGGAKDDPTKKILEGDLKAIQAYVDEERNALKARGEYLNAYFEAGYLSIATYYEKKQDAQREDVAVTVRGYDDEIAAIRDYIAKAPKATDRETQENRIIDLTRKRTAAVQEGAKIEGLAYFERDRATREYQHSVQDLSASLLELQGNTVAAARIRLTLQNEGLRRSLKANNDTAGSAAVDELERRLLLQAELTDATKKYGIVSESLNLAQQRINIDLQSGRTTEIDALIQRSELNKAMIPLLEQQAQAYERIAEASGDPRAVLNAKRLRLEIYGLSQETDLLADKFNGIFKDSFSTAIQEFATGAKSFKDIVKDLGKSISSSISKIAADNISQNLFGKEGPLGGIGAVLSGIFGGGKSASAANAAPGAAALTSAGSVLNLAGTELSLAAASLQAAASALGLSSAASSIPDGLGGLFSSGAGNASNFSSGGANGLAGWTSGFDLLGGLAGGGDPPMGRATLVGERGAELFVPKTMGTIVPNHALRGMGGHRTTNINITVPAGTSRQSSQQIATEVGRQVQVALRRNN